jgi:hypothetical protein
MQKSSLVRLLVVIITVFTLGCGFIAAKSPTKVVKEYFIALNAGNAAEVEKNLSPTWIDALELEYNVQDHVGEKVIEHWQRFNYGIVEIIGQKIDGDTAVVEYKFERVPAIIQAKLSNVTGKWMITEIKF